MRKRTGTMWDKSGKKPNYEDLQGVEFEAEHYKFEQRGLTIPDGSEVVLSEWAIQNGFGLHPWRNRRYIKVRSNYKKGMVSILPEGNKQPVRYWAGFWQLKEPEPPVLPNQN